MISDSHGAFPVIMAFCIAQLSEWEAFYMFFFNIDGLLLTQNIAPLLFMSIIRMYLGI